MSWIWSSQELTQQGKGAYLCYAAQLKEVRKMEEKADASIGEAEIDQQMTVHLHSTAKWGYSATNWNSIIKDIEALHWSRFTLVSAAIWHTAA